MLEINVVLSLINPGDEVIVLAPYWVSYAEIIKMAEGVPVFIDTSIKNDFKISPSELQGAITNKTKMMIYSSPCNPSGSVYSKEELRSLADVLVNYPSITVLSDEIYEHINFTGSYFSIGAFPDMYNQVVTINGVSKSFAMTGWRLGYIGAPLHIAQACTKIQGQFTSGTSSILAGILMQKFGGSNKMLKDLSLGIIQGGIATAMTPFTSGLIPQFSQERKEVSTEELNPMVKGVMW